MKLEEKLEYQKYIDLRNENEKKVNRIAHYRMLFFISMLISFILKYYYYPNLFQVIFILSLVVFLSLVIIHDKYFKLYDYYDKYVCIIEKYLERKKGNWKNFSDNGADFLNDQNQYLRDLDVLGERSLFQYLTVCQTLGGRRKLVEKLSNPNLSEKKLKEEQNAMKELSNNPVFMIQFQVKMQKYQNKKVDLTAEFSKFTKDLEKSSRDLWIAGICCILAILLLLLGILGILPMRYFYGFFLFNYSISFLYTSIYQSDFANITRLIQTYSGLTATTEVIQSTKFSSTKLKRIQKDIIQENSITKKMNRLDTMNSLKDNLLAGLICNGLFCSNLILRTIYMNFLSHDFAKLKESITAIEELEAMISLAGLGLLRTELCLPTKTKQIKIEVQNIKHPLLEESICVANDFETASGINIITGSNMGGKTSFLRTIGINLILMNAGTFTCATSFQANYFKIFTSMRVNDDIEKGISTFYGELLRIKEAMNYLGEGNMLVLIDEIFKGTNYQDRIYGAKKVLKRLHTPQTIVFLTTHDFELCNEENVRNYHVKEYYEQDQIKFDYKIRSGKCNSTNAMYLMEKLGIIK